MDTDNKIKALRSGEITLDREGDYWNENDIEKIKNAFDSGIGLSKIALMLQRTEVAIINEIEKLNLYQISKGCSKTRNNYSCRCKGCKLRDTEVCPRECRF